LTVSIQGGPKFGTLFVRLITLFTIDHFANFISLTESAVIGNNTVTKDPTTPQVCRYTILCNISVLKVTTENKTTSVTTL